MRCSLILILAGLFFLCPLTCFAGQAKTASVTAENTFTAGILIHEHGVVRVSGTWVGTVSLQRSEDGGTTWYDTGDTWTSNGVYSFTDYSNQYYRVGVKTGGYTSGTVGLWIGDSQ